MQTSGELAEFVEGERELRLRSLDSGEGARPSASACTREHLLERTKLSGGAPIQALLEPTPLLVA